MTAKKKPALLATTVIEYPNSVRRIGPGEPIPDDFPDASIAELRKNGAIVAALPAGDRRVVVEDAGTGT